MSDLPALPRRLSAVLDGHLPAADQGSQQQLAGPSSAAARRTAGGSQQQLQQPQSNIGLTRMSMRQMVPATPAIAATPGHS